VARRKRRKGGGGGNLWMLAAIGAVAFLALRGGGRPAVRGGGGGGFFIPPDLLAPDGVEDPELVGANEGGEPLTSPAPIVINPVITPPPIWAQVPIEPPPTLPAGHVQTVPRNPDAVAFVEAAQDYGYVPRVFRGAEVTDEGLTIQDRGFGRVQYSYPFLTDLFRGYQEYDGDYSDVDFEGPDDLDRVGDLVGELGSRTVVSPDYGRVTYERTFLDRLQEARDAYDGDYSDVDFEGPGSAPVTPSPRGTPPPPTREYEDLEYLESIL